MEISSAAARQPSPEVAAAGVASSSAAEGAPQASKSEPASTASVNMLPARYDDEEEEEDVCRICRNPGDAGNPLRYPCACSGSIKFVHQDCLLQWLDHSNARQCEVCKHAFSFSPLYAENAPARLPFQEFVIGMVMKARHVLQFFLRLGFVLSVWLLIIPFITFWIWRLAFVRSFNEARRLFVSHLSTMVILTDCLHGFLLSASIVFIFLGATSLRDYFRHLRELGGQDVEREDDEDRNGRVARRPAVQPDRNVVGDGNGEDAAGAQGIVGGGQIIRRNAENVAARWEMQAAPLEAHVEQMFDGLDDADGAEDVPFDELVGMQGPVFHLVENAFTVLASNMIFLGVIIFLPFSLGRVTIHYMSWLFANSWMLSKLMPLADSALKFAHIPLKNSLTGLTNSSSDGLDSNMVNQVTEVLNASVTRLNEISNNMTAQLSGDLLKAAPVGTSRISDIATLAVGYFLVFSALVLYLGTIALIRYTKGEPLINGRFSGIATIAETIPSLFRQFVAAMRHFMTMIKVAFILVIELGVFPLMCGWWLDVCTIRMFGKSMAHRVQFFTISPLASSLVHWVVGIVYMLQISIFVSLLRGVLRNGVLYFLRDPADPNYNPFRDLVDDPVHKHARRVLLSIAVYGSLIVMLVFLPVKLAMRMAPSIFPLDISVSDPFTEIPADMLLFQICVPFAVEHFKLRATIKSLLHYWFTAIGWALGLTDFLLPRPEDGGAQENGNDEPARQNRVQAVPFGGQDRAQAVVAAAGNANGDVLSRNPGAFQDYDSDEQSDSEYSFVLRIVLMLVVGWMTLLIFNSALIVVPVSLGRKLFDAIPLFPITHGVKCHDIYAFIIGSYVSWTALAGARYMIEHIRTKRTAVLLGQIWKWCCIVFKSSALLSIWIFVIPVMIGLLFELLVIVPMRVPVDKSPVFLLYQDWALGLIFLKIWTRLVMLDQVMPFVDESWRWKFERVREDGFSRLQSLWVLREIVIPIMMKLLTALCVPYVLARGVFPVLGYPLVVNSAVYRFAWLGCLGFGLICFCTKRFHVWFRNLHNSIRDDRYLIGRRLHNYGEGTVDRRKPDEADPSGSNNFSSSPVGNLQAGGSIGNDREADTGLRMRLANRHDA